MEIIPALDLRGGQVVRLEQGDYARETVFDADPGNAARRFVSAGATRLHVVDLDGARSGEPRNLAGVEAILAAAGPVPIQVGGGLRSLAAIESVLAAGVDRVILGTAAIESPGLIEEAAKRFPARIVLGVDARDGCVAIKGWLETTPLRVEDLIQRVSGLPLAAILHTDIGRDGMLQGPNVEATARLARSTSLPLIASGGVSSLEDLLSLARERVIAAVVVGRALYAGAIDLAEALEEVARC